VLNDAELEKVVTGLVEGTIKGSYKLFLETLLLDNCYILESGKSYLTYILTDDYIFITYFLSDNKKKDIGIYKKLKALTSETNLPVYYKADNQDKWQNHSTPLNEGCYELKMRG
jgi:hypothetical protein